MINRISFLVLFLSLICFSALSAENTSKIMDKNDFGGITYQTIYQIDDAFYQKYGLSKSIAYYDYENKIKKAEFYYHEASVNKNNITQKIETYDENQKIQTGEFSYTGKFAEKEGYTKKTETYNSRGDLLAEEFRYTDRFVDQFGYSKSITAYSAGHYIKQKEYYYEERFVKKMDLPYYTRIDIYIYVGNYKKEKISKTVFLDKDGKEMTQNTSSEK